jgi:hypothetical protein
MLLRVAHFCSNQKQWEVLTRYLLLGAGLTVTGWLRDIVQNFFPFYFGTGSSRNLSYLKIVFLIAFLD